MKKLNAVLGVVTLAVLVTACHKNPLITNSETESAKLLLNASLYAEQTAGRMITGVGFQDCMGENLTRLNCAKFYKDMTVYANKTKGFKGLAVADLKNRDLYNKLQPAYEKERFASI